ncbi:MAG TPA: efflux RND transporter periplasmic adaptor subunit, partial [Thermoanaerobaculia bacterium]|nr:efflux RND transporter periplasmic adaptor subunit [Thermoanaerobaculia bacterium]
EEQWRSHFATAWVRAGELAGSASGLARVRPPAGGEASLTAPVDGVVRPASRAWPFVGLRVDRGSPLFQVVPHVAAERSLAALEADLAALQAELEPARARLARLEELLALEAASGREVEEARTRVETLAARHSAAARDLRAARSSREGGPAGGLVLRAPFAGEVAGVTVSPGATVAAGEALARLVRTDAVWLEVALPPAGARRLAAEGVRGVVLTDPERDPVRVEEGLRVVSVAPEASPATGTVAVLLEAPAAPDLVLGTTLEAQVLTEARSSGVVIPASALVDDGGVPVVYLQLSGESFVRQEVDVVERQGELLLVERLVPGQRLVTRGGDAIRRSSLMATGEAHGHVH